MLVLLSLASAAPTAFYDLGLVLQPNEDSVFAAGVGAPSVEWDGSQYVLYFESPAPTDVVPEGCANSFQIGRATSPDGVAWSFDAEVNFGPGGEAGSARYCSAAQPAVLFDGSQWNLFWSASREPAGNATTNEPTGLGWATSPDGLTWTVLEESLVPFESESIGLASATALNGVLHLAWSEDPDLYTMMRPISGGSWSAPVRMIDHAAVGDWASDWVLGPSLICNAESVDEPLAVLFGGDTSGVFERNLGWASSTQGTSWPIEPQPFVDGTLDYGGLNHWEVLRSGGSGYTLWYSRTDEATGHKAIGAAFTDTLLGEPHPRACPNPWAEPDDTGAESDAEYDCPDAGCGCATPTWRAPLGMAAGALLLAARRRGHRRA